MTIDARQTCFPADAATTAFAVVAIIHAAELIELAVKQKMAGRSQSDQAIGGAGRDVLSKISHEPKACVWLC